MDLLAMVVVAAFVGVVVAIVLVRLQRATWQSMGRELRDDLAAERDARLGGTIDSLVAVAGEKFGAHTAVHTQSLQATKGLIDQQLTQMRAELERVTGLVRELETERASQYGQLARQITDTGRQTAELADTTRSLREALSHTTARGQWGERMAEDVLQLAGFLEGVNYEKQRRLASGGVPDFTFLLPRGLYLHMDVKFPLSNYLRYLEATTETDRERLRRDFLRDTRQRVRELAAREYIDPDETVDCVLLFIPNEQLYAFVQDHDPEVLDIALRSKVVLCSPLTLFAVLAVIRQAADNFHLERTSDEILSLLGTFGTQWQKFTAQLETVGTHLERAQRAYETVVTTRRRQLERPLDKLEELRRERGLPAGEGQSRLRAVPE